MKNFGVYIDADNVSTEMTELALEHIIASGNILLIKAFGNWSRKPGGWSSLVNLNGIETIHRFNMTKSKNAADISLVVDATAALHNDCKFDTLAVISSDCDFLPLVQHAKSLGLQTLGLGMKKAPECYRKQCNTFIELDAQETLVH